MFPHPEGLWIGFGSILLFHGSVYVLVALMAGWRFGYWIMGAATSAIFLILTTFWLLTALGPRGIEPHWIPVASAADSLAQVTVNGETLTTVSTYPGAGWESAPDPKDESVKPSRFSSEIDPFKSAIGNCVGTPPDKLAEDLKEVCTAVQALLPDPKSYPRVEGVPVTMVPDLADIRFSEESGTTLAVAEVRAVTKDPRITDDMKAGKLLGPTLKVAAFRDPGSLRLPAWKYFIGSILMLLFHMLGLSRAEKRKLSPVAAASS